MPPFLPRLRHLVTSMKTALGLIIVIACASLLGVIIPQGAPPDAYVQRLGDFWGKLVLFTHGNDIFNAGWYIALLGLLALNLTGCLIFKIISLFSAGRRLAGQGLIKAIGSFVFHLGILALLAGGLLTKLAGYSEIKDLSEGQIISLPGCPQLARVDSFRIAQDAQGQLKNYQTSLSIVNPDSSSIFSRVVEVNQPLRYKDVYFYQMRYAEDAYAVKSVRLFIQGPGIIEPGADAVFDFNRPFVIPGTSTALTIRHYVADFVMDTHLGKIYSRTDQPRNPAVAVEIAENGQPAVNQWCFLKRPNMHQTQSAYKVTFLEYTPAYRTGIQIKKNPGIPAIWAGIIAMSIGIFPLLFANSKLQNTNTN